MSDLVVGPRESLQFNRIFRRSVIASMEMDFMKRISLTCLAAAVTLLSGSQAYSQSGPFRTASWSNNSPGGVQFSSSDYVPASFPGDGGCQDCQGGYSEWAGADEVACMDGNCETSEAKRRHRLGGVCGT